VRLLFVCTGNECRSPMAEGLVRAWAREALGDEPETAGVDISSAGLAATPGRPMAADSASAVSRYGVHADDFRSRLFVPRMAEEADLVLTMTREQRRRVLSATPRGLRRTFTLREAADLLHRVDLSGRPGTAWDDRAAHLAVCLDAARAIDRAAVDDDIVDPIGQPASVHRAVAEAIATALRPLIDVLLAGVRPGPAS
jgi:protein-tyrosine phosphatase